MIPSRSILSSNISKLSRAKPLLPHASFFIYLCNCYCYGGCCCCIMVVVGTVTDGDGGVDIATAVDDDASFINPESYKVIL
jgi:hypothetical protein